MSHASPVIIHIIRPMENIYIQYLCRFLVVPLCFVIFWSRFESKTTIYVYLINILCLLEYVYIVIITY